MKGQTNKKILEPKLQRRLRKNPTDAEQRLWACLRRKQMEHFKFRRQHPFGDYVIDFVCLEATLAVEVDGGQHAENRQADAVRTRNLMEAGFKVLRFWNNDVLRDIEAVKESIWLALQERRDPSPSQPSPSRGRLGWGWVRVALLNWRCNRCSVVRKKLLRAFDGNAHVVRHPQHRLVPGNYDGSLERHRALEELVVFWIVRDDFQGRCFSSE